MLYKSKILDFSSNNGGESANAIKIQIRVTLIANLLLTVIQKGLKRNWSFSGLATMVRITLIFSVAFYSLFNNPKKRVEKRYF